MSKVIFPSVQNGETKNLSFDYSSLLGVGESVSSAICVASVFSGVDSNPASLLSGSSTIAGNVITQAIIPRITGNIYQVSMEAVTSLSQTLFLEGFISVLGGLI